MEREAIWPHIRSTSHHQRRCRSKIVGTFWRFSAAHDAPAFSLPLSPYKSHTP
jgi:hypothetical protein